MYLNNNVFLPYFNQVFNFVKLISDYANKQWVQLEKQLLKWKTDIFKKTMNNK